MLPLPWQVIEEVSSNPLSGLSAHSSPVSLGAEQGRGLCRVSRGRATRTVGHIDA